MVGISQVIGLTELHRQRREAAAGHCCGGSVIHQSSVRRVTHNSEAAAANKDGVQHVLSLATDCLAKGPSGGTAQHAAWKAMPMPSNGQRITALSIVSTD